MADFADADAPPAPALVPYQAHDVPRCGAKLVPATFRYAAALFLRPAGLHAGRLRSCRKKRRAAVRRFPQPRSAETVRHPNRLRLIRATRRGGCRMRWRALALPRSGARRRSGAGGGSLRFPPPSPPSGGGLALFARAVGSGAGVRLARLRLCGSPPVPPDGGGGFPPRPPPRGGLALFAAAVGEHLPLPPALALSLLTRDPACPARPAFGPGAGLSRQDHPRAGRGCGYPC